MGYSGGIAVFNSDDFKLDISHFKTALRERWSDIQIRDVFEGNIDFGMTMKGRFDDLTGSTIKQQQVGWWDGYEEFAEFCVWFRKYIPAEYQLLAWSKDFYNYAVISPTITEEQIAAGIKGVRSYFEISSPTNTHDTFRLIAQRFEQDWSESIAETAPDVHGVGHWFLRSQQGFIEFDKGKIRFDDNDLRSAAQIAVWCRTLLSSDQIFKGEGYFDARTRQHFEIELTSSTTEDELFDFLTKSFAKE